MDLTKKQLSFLKSIKYFRSKFGKAPSLMELVKITGVSDVKSAYRITKALIEKRYLNKEEGKARSIYLTDKATNLFEENFILDKNRQLPLFTLFSERTEFRKNDVRVFSSSSESDFSGYENTSLKNNGTNFSEKDIKQVLIKSASSLVYSFLQEKKIISNFSWGFLLIILTWSNILIIGKNFDALLYSIFSVFIIKFIEEKI